MTSDAGRRPRLSVMSALLERGWVLLVTMVALGLLAFAVAGLQSATYTSEATLVISPTLGQAAPINAASAQLLARSYAGSVPEDEQLDRRVRRAAGGDGTLTAEAPDGDATLEVTFSASSRAAAIDGARAAADALGSDAQATSSVVPGSLRVVRRPTTARFDGDDWQAVAVLTVPGAAASVNADQANKLAATYAGIIPADDETLDAVGRQIGESRNEVARNLAVVNEQNTSILRVTFKADSARKAASGAEAVARFVAGPRPASGAIIPSSVKAIAVPRNVGEPTENKAAAIPIGVVLGLALGLVLLVAWERSDPHVRDPRDLSAALGCPATPVDRLSQDAAYALIERWASLTDRVPAHVAVLPADPATQQAAEEAIELLLGSGGGAVRYEDGRSGGVPEESADRGVHGISDVVLVHAGPAGGDSAGEAVALGCDLTVVVVRQGVSATELRALAEDLSDFGIVPAWSLLVPRRFAASRSRAATPVGAATS